uniref:Uncharacterized protein n=1 Tax=Sphaerodactylus townsendi TaxID=933632 RepID=A0ACB8EWN8_9SAUR
MQAAGLSANGKKAFCRISLRNRPAGAGSRRCPEAPARAPSGVFQHDGSDASRVQLEPRAPFLAPRLPLFGPLPRSPLVHALRCWPPPPPPSSSAPLLHPLWPRRLPSGHLHLGHPPSPVWIYRRGRRRRWTTVLRA